MNTARRVCCHLPATLKSLCETGCVYRESHLRHLACPIALKTECAAPCYPEPCPCTGSKPKMDDAKRQKLKYKYYHEVFTL